MIDEFDEYYDKLDELLKNYKCSEPTLRPNYINIPCTLLTPNSDNAKIFNEILATIKNTDMEKLTRTKSGGISYGIGFRIPSYNYTFSNSGAELIILLGSGFYRIQFRPQMAKSDDTDKTMSGRIAFKKFTEILRQNNINIEDYAVDNGEEIKKEIEKPLISLQRDSYRDLTIPNCHHIDFHNSYPGGLKNTHPEFGPVIDMLYAKRKENSVYKAILNYSIGFMQSKWVGFKYATLSRDAIKNNNDRIRALSKLLEDNDRIIIAYNTDGIWYCGDIFHGEGEGHGVGEWENDHINCQLRFKSAGSYEFIENNVYTPVVRGYTTLDRVKDRSEWSWGDIYKTGIVMFKLDETGIHEIEGM